MSRRRKTSAFIALAIVLAASAVAIASQIRPAREISVAITGDAGQRVDATFVVDGQKHTESLAIPTTRTFNASTLHFWIARKSDSRSPMLRVETSLAGQVFGAADATSDEQCAYGGICTASLFRIRRERSYTHPAPHDVVAQLVTPPGFPRP